MIESKSIIDKRLINLIKTIVEVADKTKVNIIVDFETLKEKECKEIKLKMFVTSIEELKKIIKENEYANDSK